MNRRLVAFVLVAVAAAVAVAGGCLFDGSYKHRNPTVPEALGDGWEVATPESVGLDPAALAAIHEELLREDQWFASMGFLVIKDGKLVFETYLRRPEDRDHIHHLQSATKSVTSLLFGIARDHGWTPPLDTTLCSVLGRDCDGLEEAKHGITLRHLFTMRSGLDFDNSSFAYTMVVDTPENPLRYILERPLYAAPGREYRYRDADPQLLAYALHRLTGRTEQSLAEEYLFPPLGIRDYYWEPLPDGETMGAFGLHLRPRDFAKLGQLALEGGAWRGARVVSQEWLAEATTKQTDTKYTETERVDYGYYWWIANDAAAYSACGHGGQYAFVVPSRNLVLVHIAWSDSALHGDRLPDFVALTRPLWEAP